MHIYLARLSSLLYLLALMWVSVFVICMGIGFLFLSGVSWLETSGTASHLVRGILYVGPPVLALSIVCGLASHCPHCGRRYVHFVWLSPQVGLSKELNDGVTIVRSHIQVAFRGRHHCEGCGAEWLG